MKGQWRLSSFDAFCLGMTIKGAWIYRSLPDFDTLKAALVKVLAEYPVLRGRYEEASKSIIWDSESIPDPVFETVDASSTSISDIRGIQAYKLVKEYDVKAFKNGKNEAFSASLVKLKDGAALVVQCAHAALDGNSFYKLIGQWASVTKGESITPMVVDQSLLPDPTALPKEKVEKRILELGWPKIGLKSVVKMIFNAVRMAKIKDTVNIDISQEEISALRDAASVRSNAALCAIAMKKLLKYYPNRKTFLLAEVADLRNRVDGIPDSFCGNISQSLILPGRFTSDSSLEELASDIQKKLDLCLDNKIMDENTRLSLASSEYSLPYFPFDASKMNCPNPELFYINNQLKFRANEIDFGQGIPEYAVPNDLADMVKFWQPVSGGPVQVIFAGYLAKKIKEL